MEFDGHPVVIGDTVCGTGGIIPIGGYVFYCVFLT